MKASEPLVFVTVGTDHHPFHRMVRWVDGWLASGAKERVHCLVQFGTSERPRLAEGQDYLPYSEMESAMAQALAVVCHGGPGSVMMARWLGKKPIVVPRRHGLGEHVDDHQRVFASRMAREGELELVEEEGRFREILDGAIAGTVSLELSAARAQTEESLARFERLVERLAAQR
jgi:UDP-N-acetylglucosamine transferase subunit ALG13